MRYIDAFRDTALVRELSDAIRREADPDRSYAFMEFCGGHTHAISRYGLADLLPETVRLVHGPGCPVCVLPVGRIDMVIDLVRTRPDVTLCTYGDCLRVPASGGLSLQKVRALGGRGGSGAASVRMVHSVADALALARSCPDREVVFFAIGFETTTPPTALALRQAAAEELPNFSVICNHVLTPPAMAAVLAGGTALDGILGPAHVSSVIGTGAYGAVAAAWGMPVVVAGFEPLDILQAILMLVRQVSSGRAEVENEFSRGASPEGNMKARQLMDEVFRVRGSFEWRGLGSLPGSALEIAPPYARFDAEARFGLTCTPVPDPPGCACAAILRGRTHPRDCGLFATVCTPENPVGSCMVSGEGACAAYYASGRHRVPVGQEARPS
ncbi:hydrogenase formation protein HypD [Phaeovibrio sulfidiphilus]|uniref:Hydrogenase maturation factor n=1 Tax=Phaeovibrio sulfidiphilus TaxID=1220600 RepID=A0A8J6YP27_9PROT|nr:hydrogenase formation protein HypD [Phaeovibrio sulfidiphilus]MBE1236562.1 hydrogenase formation protein HypD [Phaeovibrio sulfidiphilus]